VVTVIRFNAAFPGVEVTVAEGAIAAPSAAQETALVTVMFAVFVLKNTLPIAFTIIRPLPVLTDGITIFSVPSLAVELINV
jgi:hypothetical protein